VSDVDMAKKWAVEVFRTLVDLEDQGKPAQDLGEAVMVAASAGAVPSGTEQALEVMAHAIGQATRALGRTPTAADFKGEPLRELLKRLET
jgi:hypothetical protein